MKNYERSWSERFDQLDVVLENLGMEVGMQEQMDLLEQIAISLG